MSSFKSSENIQSKGDGPDRSVSDSQSSSVTLNELAMKARKSYCNFKLQQRSQTMTNINLKIRQVAQRATIAHMRTSKYFQIVLK